MRIVQESRVRSQELQELQNGEVFSSASNLNFTSAPASSSWLLALCNSETQSSASAFRIFTCTNPWVAPGESVQRQHVSSALITPAPYRYSAAPPASKKVW
jgi:hypothetical protein